MDVCSLVVRVVTFIPWYHKVMYNNGRMSLVVKVLILTPWYPIVRYMTVYVSLVVKVVTFTQGSHLGTLVDLTIVHRPVLDVV